MTTAQLEAYINRLAESIRRRAAAQGRECRIVKIQSPEAK